MVDPLGFSGRDISPEQEKINREILEREKKRRRRSRKKTPSVSVKGGVVFIGGQGFSVAPSLQEKFIREKTGGVSSSIQQSINREMARQEVLRKAEQERIRQQQEKERLRKIELEKKRTSVAFVEKFRKEKEQRERIKFEENNIKREIERLNKARFQAKNKQELDKIVRQKLEREKELRLLRSGVTQYNRKVNLEVERATKEFNRFVENEVKDLQARVNAGKLDPDSANRILENKAKLKEKEINNNLNKNISKIRVPEALKESIGVVRAVEPPKGFIEKQIAKIRQKPSPKIDRDKKALEESVEGLKEIGRGIALGGLSFARGIKELPKTITTLVKNPLLIKEIPRGVKTEIEFIGNSLKLSPTRTVVAIGTELFLTAGTGIALKVLGKVTKPSQISKFITQLSKVGKLKRLNIKFKGGKFPKIEIILKDVAKGFNEVKVVKSVTKDFSKLIPKIIPKAKIVNINKLAKPFIESWLKDKRVIAELTRKFPSKTRFGFKEFKQLRSYSKLRTQIKREVFSKFDVKAIRKARKVKKGKREISGVKVGRKEFKSFQEADLEFRKIKRIGKLVNKIKSEGGIGKIETLPRKAISTKELDLLEVAKGIPKQLLKNVKSVSTNTFIQKFSAEVPIIKRFGDLKKGFWRVLFKDKTFYQNSASFSLFDKGGKSLGTITFNSLSSKPLTRFRSVGSALKWGSNKNVVFSKLVGKDFVKSFVIKMRGQKITKTEFLSRIKLTNRGNFQDILIKTRKIPRVSPREITKRFKKAIPVSITKARVQKITQRAISKFDPKKRIFEIVQRGKIVKKIKTGSIINPVVIDTSVIESVVNVMSKINRKALSKARLTRLRQSEKLIRLTKKTRPFIINNKPKVIISKTKLQQITKISNELKSLKESLAVRTITPRIKITRRLEGIKELRKLKRVENSLRKLRRDLVRARTLDVASKTAIATSLLLLDKFKKDLSKRQVILTDTRTKQILRKVQKSVRDSKNKKVIETITKIKTIIPVFTIVTPRRPRIKTPIPKIKKRIIIRKKKEEERKKMFKRFAKPVRIFNVVVRKRGRKLILNNRLAERDALNFMALELDTQLLRSARLEQTGTSKIARRLLKKYDGAFAKRKNKLRQFKTIQKKKLQIKGFIEKKKYALDTKREKAQLKRTRKKAVKKKAVKRKKLTKKTKVRKRK